MPQRLNMRDPGFEAAFAAFLDAKREDDLDVNQTVGAILAEVRAKGDEAVIAYTQRFDNLTLTPETMLVSHDEIEKAVAACPKDVLQALELMAQRVSDFHSRQCPEDLDYSDDAGLKLGYRWTPIEAVGLYVPGGTAAYPSSVLMNALPAKVAGVDRLAMVVPAPSGNLSSLVLAAAKIAGIDEIYRVGGAQAVSALAFGTATIAPVDKIVGPGNAYVAAAKRQVFGTVGIDMIAGPSEVLVVADGANDPRWIAADLLAQAEHDPSAQAILITTDMDFADAVLEAIDRHLDTLPRAEIARESWDRFGAVVTVGKLDEAVRLIDRLAPEHLELAIDDPETLAAKVRNAGAIFLGRHTPEALGDYVAGPNHVLPTSRSARFSSGLGVLDFVKRSTFIGCDAEVLAKLGPAARTLAEAEGLSAHALSLSIRLEQRGKD
ncbi:MAG: histidinol dehydrogenase [Rhodospirillales bacterium]|jgi:histidinol dehydrogenase|nr:histidinol dehydrogenase [Rhodospirillales bacterium]MDP7650253.1 histidinol dehydrogenase [Rhodospirillales bacterium]HJO96636.1 histidinol dehydrogenase [Rhodospirillales bacterium]